MSSPTDTEVKSFRAAVETLGIEAEILLEHLPTGEVLAALCMAAADLARRHKVGPASLTRIYGQVLANELDVPLVVSIRSVAKLDDDTEAKP